MIRTQLCVREDGVRHGARVFLLQPLLDFVPLVVVAVCCDDGVLEELIADGAEQLVRGVVQGVVHG